MSKKFDKKDWYFCAGHRGYSLWSMMKGPSRYCITFMNYEDDSREIIAEYEPGEHSSAVRDFANCTAEPWLVGGVE